MSDDSSFWETCQRERANNYKCTECINNFAVSRIILGMCREHFLFWVFVLFFTVLWVYLLSLSAPSLFLPVKLFNHRIIEWLGLEGALKIMESQLPLLCLFCLQDEVHALHRLVQVSSAYRFLSPESKNGKTSEEPWCLSAFICNRSNFYKVFWID